MLRIILISHLTYLTTANAVVNFNEAISGDLSDDYLNPNQITLSEGDNEISGGLLGGSADLDLFSFTIPTGFELPEISVTRYTGGNNGSFLLLQSGSTLSSEPSNTFSDPIGFTILNDTSVQNDTNLLNTVTIGPPFNSNHHATFWSLRGLVE